MPVGGVPIVRRIAGSLVGHGVVDLVMNLHHVPESIAAVVGDGSDLGAAVRYSWEQPQVLGSAGGPRHALGLVDADRFFIVNGDTLTDLDVGALGAAHAASGALVTMALVPNRDFGRYGGVRVDEGGRVTGFSRRGPDSEGSWHFIGVQAAEASVFAALPDGVLMNTVGGVYDELIRTRPGSVRAFRCDAAFWDVGTPADYLRTSKAFGDGGLDAGRGARLDATASVTDSVLWDDVEVGPGAKVDTCIVTDGVRIPAGASYERAILMRRGDALSVSPIEM